MNMLNFKFLLCLFVAILILTGCGGSSSSSGSRSPQVSTPTPTPTQTPVSAPDMILHIRKTTIYEGEVFEINAEDAGGNVSIRQTGGPQAERLGDVNLEHFRFRAPDYDIDIVEVMTFEIEATFSGVPRVRELAITVLGFEGPGRVVGEFDAGLKLIKGDGDPLISYSFGTLSNVIAVEDRGNENELVFLGANFTGSSHLRDYSQTTNPVMNYIFSDISAVKVGKLGFTLFDIFADEFLVLQEKSNSVKWFISEYSNDDFFSYVSFQDEIMIEAPCEFVGRTSTGEDFVWIGQRNRGFSTVRLEAIKNEEGVTRGFNDTVIQSLNNGRSHCLIYPTRLPDEIVARDPYTPRIPDLIALDYDTNELVLYADTDFNEQYEELDSIPLQANSSEPLEVVDAFAVGWPSQSPRYIVVLLTDGEHDGQHRLVLVSLDIGLGIKQTTFSWDEGVPVSLIYGTFSGTVPGDQYAKDIVVIREGVDTALYFDNVTPPDDVISMAPTFAEPVIFQIGGGAKSGVLATPNFIDQDPDDFAVKDILVSYPDSGQLRLFRVHDELMR